MQEEDEWLRDPRRTRREPFQNTACCLWIESVRGRITGLELRKSAEWTF